MTDRINRSDCCGDTGRRLLGQRVVEITKWWHLILHETCILHETHALILHETHAFCMKHMHLSVISRSQTCTCKSHASLDYCQFTACLHKINTRRPFTWGWFSHVQPVDMPLIQTPLTCALLLSLCFHFLPLFNVHQPPLPAFSVYKNLVLYLFYITKTKNFHSLYKSSFLALLGMCLRNAIV